MKRILIMLLLLTCTSFGTNSFLTYQLHPVSDTSKPDTLQWNKIKKKFRVKTSHTSQSPEEDVAAFQNKGHHLFHISNPHLFNSIYGSNGFLNWYASSISANYVLLFQIKYKSSENELVSDYIWSPVVLLANEDGFKITVKGSKSSSFSVNKGRSILGKEFPLSLSSGIAVENITIKPITLLLISNSTMTRINELLEEHITKLQSKYSVERCNSFRKRFGAQKIIPIVQNYSPNTYTPSTSPLEKKSKREIIGSIAFQANIFQALLNDTLALDYNTKIIPATIEFSMGNPKASFVIGAGAYRTKIAPTNAAVGVVDSLNPLVKRIFSINVGVHGKVFEKKRFRLNYINKLSVFNIMQEDIKKPTSNGNSNHTYSVEEKKSTNVEFFSGFEPNVYIADRFSLFTRSGVSLLWMEAERNKFRIAPRALHGGIGLRFHF